jgi:hypothetical protein
LLDGEVPDYFLVPGWDASILIISKGACPRECSHCESGQKGKGIARLIGNWQAHLDYNLPRIEV